MSLLEGESQATESTESTEAQSTETAETNGWFYADGVAGEGDKPEWFMGDKYGSIADQAAAYPQLAQRFGGFTGAPEEYTVQLDESLEYDFGENNPILDEVLKVGKELNMSNDAMNKLLNTFAGAEAQMEKLAAEEMKHVAEQERAKLGDNAAQRIESVKQMAGNVLPEDQFAALSEALTTAGALEAVETLLKSTKNNPIPANIPQQQAMTQEKLNDMINAVDEATGQHRMSIDPEYAKRVRGMIKQFNGVA